MNGARIVHKQRVALASRSEPRAFNQAREDGTHIIQAWGFVQGVVKRELCTKGVLYKRVGVYKTGVV